MARYRSRISGLLLERIDLVVELPVESQEVELLWQESRSPQDSTTTVLLRVEAARAFSRQPERGAINARLDADALCRFARPDPGAERLLAQAATKWSLSARAVHRTLRVARTLADLSASETIATEAVAEALSYRHETLRLS